MAIEDLINFNIATAQQFVFDAADAIAAINVQKGTRGYSFIDIGNGGFNARYDAPDKDNTPFPFYEPPPQALPTVPDLVELHGVTKPTIPSAPTVSTSGLFTRSTPDEPIPDFTNADPVLHVDELLDKINAIAQPVLESVTLPSITPFSIGTMPTLQLPDYESPVRPSQLSAPVDYAANWQVDFNDNKDIIKAFADDQMAQWLSQYAPDYQTINNKLSEKLLQGMDGGVLPDEFEDRLFSRHEARINKEQGRAELAAINDNSRRGWIVPPGAVAGRVDTLRTESFIALSGQSTEVYLERRRSEVAYLQAVLGLSQGLLDGLRSQVIQYANFSLGVIQSSVSVATEIANRTALVFEHEKSRREFSLALMAAVGNEFDIRLKSALSGLEGYKLELDTIGKRSDVEMKQIDAVKLQLEAQQLEVNLYSALVNAVKDQAAIDELSLREFSVKGDIFNYRTNAVLASYKAYEAYIAGDKGKLEGELSKLDLYSKQIESLKLGVEVETAVLEGDTKTNAARLAQYTGELQGFEIATKVALQKFLAEKELKALGLDVYRTDAQIAQGLYQESVKKELAFLEAKISAFGENSRSQQEFFRLDQRYAEMNTNAQQSVAQAYANMASSLANATNTSLSIASQG